jgi:hypothetical protein
MAHATGRSRLTFVEFGAISAGDGVAPRRTLARETGRGHPGLARAPRPRRCGLACGARPWRECAAGACRQPGRRDWARLLARGVAGLLVLAAALGWRPPLAAAHPRDEYLQALYLTLGADGVTVELALSPGVRVAPQMVAVIDED